ncbi:hypothetical protein OG321_35280 [Streptomyces sp. NBC_00424]|uniref:hypothetical protein n=1 Tax=Streptomyces sp. NBC_00424 TaxID=2903648 RepID=UPI002259B119|nr:hypothetical protein [Streptomyces sp. NBC_00424]MCX5077738.1 hypothetical protein [Streptomyces sp. NBC_00424]
MLTRNVASLTGPGRRTVVLTRAWALRGNAPDGKQVAHILLAHRLGPTSSDTASAIEARMRHRAVVLGDLAQAEDSIRATQGTLATIGPRVLLDFPGVRWRLRLPAHPQGARSVRDSGRTALVRPSVGISGSRRHRGWADVEQSATDLRPGRTSVDIR